jgi:hypothetical protein
MPDPDPTIALRLSAILTSRPARRLDYWLGGFHVTGTGLATIARAMLTGKDGRTPISVNIAVQEEGVAASYQIAENQISVPRMDWAVSDRFERLATVHEAIHALRDLQGQHTVWNGKKYRSQFPTDEAAAYIGGCLFDIYWQEECLGVVSSNPEWLKQRKSPTHAVAYRIALAHAARTAGGTITREELKEINKFTAAGIKGKSKDSPWFKQDYDGIKGAKP